MSNKLILKSQYLIDTTCISLQDGKMLVWDAFTTNKVNKVYIY